MANSYAGSAFDIDTSVNVAGLIALKGGAPALTDKICVVNGATFTVEQDLSILQIVLGETSSGAAGAGNRYGKVVQDAGTKITFAGHTTNIFSGVDMTPASADSSSKDNGLTVNGTSGSPCEWVNDGEAADTNKKYCCYHIWGEVQVDYLNIKYQWSHAFYLAASTARTNASGFALTHLTVGRFNATGYLFYFSSPDIDIPVDLRWADLTHEGNAAYLTYLHSNVDVIAGGSIDCRGYKHNWTSGAYQLHWLRGIAGSVTYSNFRHSLVDIRPTTTVPTNPAASDDATSGTLTITWDNKTSYATGDLVYVYNNSGDALLGILDATAGTGKVTGLTDDQEYTMYLKATSGGEMFSAATATFTGTPTGAASNLLGPGLAVSDDGDGSVTIDVTNNQDGDGDDQTSKLFYKKPGATSWTEYGTTFTGDVADHTGLTGLDYDVYWFMLWPYDAGSGLYGVPGALVILRLVNSSATRDESNHDDELAADLADLIGTYAAPGEMGEALVYTASGQSPVNTAGIVGDEVLQLTQDRSGKGSLYRRDVTLLTSVATAPSRKDTITIGGDVWEVVDYSTEIAGGIEFTVQRYIATSKGASPARTGRRG